MRPLRRALACLLALALLWHGAAVASAFEYDPMVHCCCGDHDEGHKCGCKHCPGEGAIRLRKSPAPAEPESSSPSYRPCAGKGTIGALGSLPIVTLPVAQKPLAPGSRDTLFAPPRPALRDRLILADRPPP